jgi:hypothetical protein
MAREVRITVDDDEVFERMKRRKQALDLSWEEVLHRGLRPESRPEQQGGRGDYGPGPDFDPGPGPDFDPGPNDDRGHGRRAGDRARGERDRWDAFADDLESQIQSKVYDTLRSSFGAAGIDVPDRSDLDEEMGELERAEDATLVFEFLDDRREYRVPLRVNLHTGRDGVDVDVVAVRQGKSVRDTNRFDGGARKQVNARLAGGDPAELRFADGAETYAVRPILSWGRDESGDPTVTDVEIDEVLLDDDR